MRQLSGEGNLNVWYTEVDMDDFRARFDGLLKERQRKAIDQGLAKARTRDSMQSLGKLTRIEDGRPQIISDPPVVVPLRDLLGDLAGAIDIEKELKDLIGTYRRTLQPDRRVLLEQYEFADMARKVVGVGSVGTQCWIVLMFGRDESDPLFLQVKEAEESVLARFAGRSKFNNEGERVVNGQRLMQAASDIFLGWQHVPAGLDGKARDFYIRQLRDWKFSVDIAAMIPRGLRLYGELCGLTLARAHARSGDEIAIAAYLGGSAGIRQRDRGLRRGVRRPEREGLPGLHRGHQLGPPARRARRVAPGGSGRGPGSRREPGPRVPSGRSRPVSTERVPGARLMNLPAVTAPAAARMNLAFMNRRSMGTR